jgi:hypothetical protein
LERLGHIAVHRVFAAALTDALILDRAFLDVLDQRGGRWFAVELVRSVGIHMPAADYNQQAANHQGPVAPRYSPRSGVPFPTFCKNLSQTHRSLPLTRQHRLKRERLEYH